MSKSLPGSVREERHSRQAERTAWAKAMYYRSSGLLGDQWKVWCSWRVQDSSREAGGARWWGNAHLQNKDVMLWPGPCAKQEGGNSLHFCCPDLVKILHWPPCLSSLPPPTFPPYCYLRSLWNHGAVPYFPCLNFFISINSTRQRSDSQPTHKGASLGLFQVARTWATLKLFIQWGIIVRSHEEDRRTSISATKQDM